MENIYIADKIREGFKEKKNIIYLKRSEFEQMKKLNMTKLKIAFSPMGWPKLTCLEEFNFNNNTIEKLPMNKIFRNVLYMKEIFQQMPNLRRLNLSNNNIELIEPGSFDRLVRLEELDLSGNQLETIMPKLFSKLKSLKSLNLSKNQLNSLKKEYVTGLVNLEMLDISKNPRFYDIESDFFTGLPKLKVLKALLNVDDLEDGTDDELTRFKMDLEGMENSEEILSQFKEMVLEQGANPKKLTLKSMITNLRKLNTLELSGLAPHLQIISNIRVLNKDHLQGFGYLKELKLKEYGIWTIDNLAFQKFSMLELLDLSQNNLLEINQKIFEPLINLKCLNLSRNRLTKLTKDSFPDSLSKLVELDLNNNKIKSIDENAFKNLKSLKKLNLNRNELETIYTELFSSLENLTYLNFSSNTIKNIEKDSFIKLQNLEELYLVGNPLISLSTELFEPLENIKLMDIKIQF